MFDMTNEEALMKLINGRDENAYIVPLYVHINNERYNLWEIDQIDNFSRSTIKIGFGSSRGLMVKSQLPQECLNEFEMLKTSHQYDYDKDVDVFYCVFESGFLNEEELTDDFHIQIQTYVEQVAEYVNQIVQEKRKQRIQNMLNDSNNYMDE